MSVNSQKRNIISIFSKRYGVFLNIDRQLEKHSLLTIIWVSKKLMYESNFN